MRRPIVLTFTPEGHAALAQGIHRTGLSRADYVESLLRRAEARRRPATVRGSLTPAAGDSDTPL